MPNDAKAIGARAKFAILCAALLAGCQGADRTAPAADNEALDEVPPRQLPIVEPPFNRSRLLLTVARVASAHSLGADDPGIQRLLDGKQFEVRLRFGCEGPAKGDHAWSIDPDGRTLRLRAVADLTLADSAVKAVAGDGVEAAEGFWLPRPWLLQASCPADRPDAAEPLADNDGAPSGETSAAELPPAPAPAPLARVGIAQFFTVEDARTRRRMNRPFETVKQLTEGQNAGAAGFDLVLSGRLQARGDKRVISCTGSGRDRPPDCIVSAAIDRVWIENPADQSVVAEWGG